MNDNPFTAHSGTKGTKLGATRNRRRRTSAAARRLLSEAFHEAAKPCKSLGALIKSLVPTMRVMIAIAMFCEICNAQYNTLERLQAIAIAYLLLGLGTLRLEITFNLPPETSATVTKTDLERN